MKPNTKLFIAKPYLAQPWLFFAASYAWTWSFFSIALWLGISAETGGLLGASLVLIALSGPAVMAVTFVKFALNQEGQSDYWKRIFDHKRISGKWYLATILLIPTIGILSAILSGYWQFISFANVTPSLLLTAIVIPFVPLAEELGWRGYALDRLQEKYSALTSSIILGLAWGFWHLPAFFLPGGGLSVMKFGTLAFWEYMGGLTALSICMTWIYNNTNRSTLSAILFHSVLELCADMGLIPWSSPELAYHLGLHVGLWAFTALAVTFSCGAASLAKKHASQDEALNCMIQDTKPSHLKEYAYAPKPTQSLNSNRYTPYCQTQNSEGCNQDHANHETQTNRKRRLL